MKDLFILSAQDEILIGHNQTNNYMDCTCGGNPKCFKCDGTGIKRSSDFNSYTRKIPKARKRKKYSNQFLTHFDLSSLNIPKDNFQAENHLQDTQITVCNICGSSVYKDELSLHEKECFKKVKRLTGQPIRKNHQKKTHEPVVKTNTIQCPHCQAQVRASKFDKHVNWKCSKNLSNARHMGLKRPKNNKSNKAFTNKQKGNDRTPSNSNTSKYSSYFESFKIEKGLDLSNGFHVRRESGRFGSFPSSDDYGEEANL